MAGDAKTQVQSIDHVYAQTLLELATEANKADAILAEVRDLAELLRQNADLRQLLENRIINGKERSESIERLFKGRIDDLLLRFLLIVNQKERLAQLPGILRAFELQYQQRAGVLEVDGYVAVKLTDAEATQLAASLSKALGKQVILQQHEDAALLGGLKLRVGDQLIDGSVATQLKLMKENIVAEGREKARQLAATI